MAISEEQIQNWARALSETENAKCIATTSLIRKILEERFGSDVKVFLQGSYANSTNVRQDSDVDIVVCYQKAYYPDLSLLSPEEVEIYNGNRVTHTYNFSKFKNDVEAILRTNFGDSTNRKEKCIKIKGNTYRINADVIPCFILKRYESPYEIAAEGVQFFSDLGSIIKNFPDQHKNNGHAKNINTNQNFKSTVRALKNCRNSLVENDRIDKKNMPSFFLECLVWNVPDPYFEAGTLKDVTNNVIAKIYSDMGNVQVADTYAEINNLHWLFRGQTARTNESARQFIEQAYNLIN